ncbi:MAG: hypothetical protein EOO75_15505 [Myxococcales bacterium]|nr:MAG: hypothetical protein EOO75_15505 [Myxococcales bacterium]
MAPITTGGSPGAYPSQMAAPESSPAAPAPPPASQAGSTARAEAARPAQAPTERPGLATHWGETRSSYIRSTSFYRADYDRPFATASLWYNDAEGARAQAAAEGFRRTERGEVGLAQSGVVVSLRDGQGRLLPGYQAGGKAFAVGDAGERYTIWLENRTPARFEVVISVDGLDVMDGQAASFQKRGYLLQPHASLEIDGFRQSEATVAAFRFGSVRGSYAGRKGDDRNVGVVGVAMFHERGVPAWPWDPQEIERRRDANPFPGQFATPP